MIFNKVNSALQAVKDADEKVLQNDFLGAVNILKSKNAYFSSTVLDLILKFEELFNSQDADNSSKNSMQKTNNQFIIFLHTLTHDINNSSRYRRSLSNLFVSFFIFIAILIGYLYYNDLISKIMQNEYSSILPQNRFVIIILVLFIVFIAFLNVFYLDLISKHVNIRRANYSIIETEITVQGTSSYIPKYSREFQDEEITTPTLRRLHNDKSISNLSIVDNFSIDIQNHFSVKKAELKTNVSSNLIFGLTAVIIAIIIIAYSIMGGNPTNDWGMFAMSFIPKITFAIFIQSFAFFFLRLYKQSFDDMKYQEDEFTELRFKLLSIKLALNMNDDEMTKSIMQNFLQIKANKILDKEQTSIEIEKIRRDDKFLEKMMEKIDAKQLLTALLSKFSKEDENKNK